jgi:hypothetical protein
MSKHSFEAVYQVWDDSNGSRIEVGPDADAIDGLSEIRTVLPGGNQETVIVVNEDQLKHLHVAIARRLADIEAASK